MSDRTPGQEECLEIERQSQLDCLRRSEPDAEDRYVAGTRGFHELIDRAGRAMDQWDQWVLNHPAAVLNRGLYQHADRVLKSIHEFYEVLYLIENDDEAIEPPVFDDDDE